MNYENAACLSKNKDGDSLSGLDAPVKRRTVRCGAQSIWFRKSKVKDR